MNPSKVQARKTVLVSVFVLVLISIYKQRGSSASAGESTVFRAAWGAGVVGMFLSLLADFVPQIAGPFAALIVLGSLTNGGEQVLAKALGIIGPPPAAAGGSGSGSTSNLTGPAGTPSTAPAGAPTGVTGPATG